MFDQDPDKRQRSREELEKFVDTHFCSNYEYSSDLEVTHNQCHKIGKIVDMFEEVEDQKLRDCRSELLRLSVRGRFSNAEKCLMNLVFLLSTSLIWL